MLFKDFFQEVFQVCLSTNYFYWSMSKKNVVIGIGLAGGALLAWWLLSGERKQKTKDFVAKGAEALKKAINNAVKKEDEQEAHYL